MKIRNCHNFCFVASNKIDNVFAVIRSVCVFVCLCVIHLNVLGEREIGMNERERASTQTQTQLSAAIHIGMGIRAKANGGAPFHCY